MLKQQARILTSIALFLDLFIVTVSFCLAFYLREPQLLPGRTFSSYVWFLLLVLPLWLATMYSQNLYASLRTRTAGSIFIKLFKVQTLAGCLSAAVIYIFEPHSFGRLLFIWFIIISFLLLLGCKLVMRWLLAAFRRKGMNIRHIILVGGGYKARQISDMIAHHECWGLKLIGSLVLDGAEPDEAIHPVLGRLSQVTELCKQQSIDEVVFCLPATAMDCVEEYVTRLDQLGVTSRMVLDFIDFPAHRREISLFHDTVPMLTFYSTAFNASQLMAKRCLDIVGALAGLLLLALMFPFVSLAIKLESCGPVFFGQIRLGEQGRPFRCWKFRSMRVDAEQRKHELLDQNEMSGQMFKMKDDPRVTRVGRFIRKTSLDEFPQFWNVLRGEMSLVGTRPPTPDEVEKYEDWHRKRICIRPGITGLWQVCGRNQIQEFDEVARLDIRYVENWSIWLDIKILFQTIWVVTLGRGAS